MPVLSLPFKEPVVVSSSEGSRDAGTFAHSEPVVGQPSYLPQLSGSSSSRKRTRESFHRPRDTAETVKVLSLLLSCFNLIIFFTDRLVSFVAEGGSTGTTSC